MKQILQFALSNLVAVFNVKWRELITPTETPSLRYVRKLNLQPMKSISGPGGYRRMMMGRIEDRDFEYIPESESSKPGYLEKRMKLYRKMVEHERKNPKVRSEQKATNNGGGVVQTLPNAPANNLQSVQRIARVK